MLQYLRDGDSSFTHGQPEDRVPLGRLITPALARFESNCEIVDRHGYCSRAFGTLMLPKQHPGGPYLRNIGCGLIDAFRRTELQIRRQRDPELETTRQSRLARSPGMP